MICYVYNQGDSMNEKLEAIKEAITFIRHNWLDNSGIWRGELNDFVGAIKLSNVSGREVTRLVKAIADGEHTPVDGITGTLLGGKLTIVRVSR